MSEANHDELISQFTDITGTTTDRATFYLESSNWTLQVALASFFEDTETTVDDVETLGGDDNEFGAASLPPYRIGESDPTAQPAKSSKDKKPKPKASSTGARIMTLNNMSSSSEDDDETGQAFYAGGSERSGQQVLGPPRKNPSKDYVSEIFRTAQESGAEILENPQAARSTTSKCTFTGSGYRLGQTDDDHVLLSEPGRANRPQNIDPVILRLWRQGFTINDGELRTYDDDRNKEFLECITKGQLPPELRQQEGNMVQVNLEDHRHEDYKQTATKIKPFAGKGHTLGSPTPNVNDIASSSTIPSSSSNNDDNEKLASEELKLDASQPATSIQIRLADGSRLSGRFNHTHTVNDLRRFISTARPQYAAATFSLLTTFPSKELTDSEQTIEKAGLLNSAILQRLK